MIVASGSLVCEPLISLIQLKQLRGIISITSDSEKRYNLQQNTTTAADNRLQPNTSVDTQRQNYDGRN